MNLKKVAIIIALTLVLSMVLVFLNPTLALTNNPQKQKTEALFNILNNTNISILLAFDRLDEQNVEIPNAELLYNEGLTYTNEAVILLKEENFDEACIQAVKAMEKFDETLRIIEVTLPEEPTATMVTAEEAIKLKAVITRAITYYEKLKNLTIKAAEAGYSTTAIEKQLREIRLHLENATEKLYARNYEGVTEELLKVKNLLHDLAEPFAKLTLFITELNTSTYLQEAEIRVSAAKEDITLSTTLTQAVKEDAITALNNSEISLTAARNLIEDNNVNDAIVKLEVAKKWEEVSKLTIATEATIPASIEPSAEDLTNITITR